MKTYVIFGAGDRGIELTRQMFLISKIVHGDLKKEEICFSDNDKTKWGKIFNNITVVPPDELADVISTNTTIIIASSFGDKIYAQLIEDLGTNHVDVEKIYKLDFKNQIKHCYLSDNDKADSIIQYVDDKRHMDYIHAESYTEVFVDRIRRAKVFVDVGAECGFYLYLAAKNMPDFGQIYAIEPDSNKMRILQQKYGNLSNVKFIDYAVSNNYDGAFLHSNSNTNRASSFIEQKNVLKQLDIHTDTKEFVKTTTLDDLFADVDVDVLKMDIEGAEVLAIDGMHNILKSGKTRIFLEIHAMDVETLKPGGIKYISDILSKYNYRCFTCSGYDLHEVYLNENMKKIQHRVYLVPERLL